MPVLFHQTKILIAQMDDYLDALSEGVIVFRQAIGDYVRGKDELFQERVTAVGVLENNCDDLRRSIERHLYSQSLIPESRGDVLGLLENLDDIINTGKATLLSVDVERPEILPGTEGDWEDLAATAAHTAEAVVLAARAFFRDPHSVSDHLHKVYFHEKEGDRVAESLKRKIFASDIDLARKAHLRDCACGIDNVSDAAEDVADRLSIYAIKRTV